ncbi:MAG: hypothetical protein HXO49_03595 [Prevotella sp.]|nr:hypothetical protein [Prevotella sp.]
MDRERAIITVLIIALFTLMTILASIERETSEIKALEVQHKAQIEKIIKEIDKLEQKQKVEKNAEELRNAEKGK